LLALRLGKQLLPVHTEGMPELLHEFPSDEELQAYCDEHFLRSAFWLMRQSRSELESMYPPETLLAVESLRALGCEDFCRRGMESIRDSLRRLNRLPRTDPLWVNTNSRPTIYKLPGFCKRILSEEPGDVLSLWTMGSLSVWAFSNHFGQDWWAQLYRLGQLQLIHALHAALLIQITSNDTADQMAEFLLEIGAVENAAPILAEFHAGAPFLVYWVDRVREVCRTKAPLGWVREPADWAALLAGGRSVLFLFVAWSGYATAGRSIVEQAARRWAKEYRFWPVSWWALDMTSGSTPFAGIAEWLAGQQVTTGLSAQQIIEGGWGPLMWVMGGKAVGSLRAVHEAAVGDLLERTQVAFDLGARDDDESYYQSGW
jgi:hypothetical protein